MDLLLEIGVCEIGAGAGSWNEVDDSVTGVVSFRSLSRKVCRVPELEPGLSFTRRRREGALISPPTSDRIGGGSGSLCPGSSPLAACEVAQVLRRHVGAGVSASEPSSSRCRVATAGEYLLRAWQLVEHVGRDSPGSNRWARMPSLTEGRAGTRARPDDMASSISVTQSIESIVLCLSVILMTARP